MNNAGGVRAGRLENIPDAELLAMIDVGLVAPIHGGEARAQMIALNSENRPPLKIGSSV